ncbi:murein biosynthesis integral membrane protein MurJ [Microbacterium paludicola]|uniref:Murein biosynthesis integral membrane protein MurJ n=1 Tax=Microbacterium paludicola TaxID=300019 RepID=A0A4Y9FWJ6_9MICO|nr:murein biosynthesis integral membrane protein MurJ [Microbacterium paludicola]MBF0816651.1 murein biosynthesis integral membrane protein MurJ [Microbacterium paludicola]TFU32633.1 murein biosynthesis integral membrane protein MurJ [Microbacterium paludicola]
MPSLGRASAMIAAGTIASRATGLIRAVVLVTAIGAFGEASDAFSVANQLPNYVFQVLSAGLITAVLVPQIVKWSAREDGGRAHLSKLFTLGTIAMLAVTAVAMLLAPWLIALLGRDWAPDQRALGTAFAYWCLPQVFFYGMFALIGETLNARRVFGPYAWAPIVNNIVSIIGFAAFIVIFGGERSELHQWDPLLIGVFGGITTFGIVAQTIVLVIFWRRTGLSLRPDFRWRGMGLGDLRDLARWSFAMLLVGLVVSVVQQQVISDASGDDASATVWMNAWLVFMLPYSIIVMSIGTPYFTQLSEHASEGRDDEVRADIGRAIRTLGLLVVIAAVALMVAAVPASRVFTGSEEQAVAAAPVLIGFLASLVPLAVQFIVQRAFYAYGDTRTPFLFTAFQAAIAIGLALLMPLIFSEGYLAAAVAFCQSLSSLAQVILASWLLHRRLGSLGMGTSIWALTRFTLAAIPAGIAAFAVYILAGGDGSWMAGSGIDGIPGKLLAAVGAGILGLIAIVVYIAILALFRAPELRTTAGLVRRLTGR